MRFEFYHAGLDDVAKLSVDGTVPNSVHFSHWQGNETAPELKADTSTEIALNLVSSPHLARFTRGIQLVTNNHFDTDGVLSVWTVLRGERALDLREQLVSAAEAGDFSELRSDAGVRASIVIQGSDQPTPSETSGSPLAALLAGEPVGDEARAYDLVLPEVERILTRTGAYEELWREPWKRIVTAMESFATGDSYVSEFFNEGLSLVMLAPSAFGPNGFDPARHNAPYTAISQHVNGRLLLVATPLRSGWAYRVDYPYYSWAETVVRPSIQRHDFADLLVQLNQNEGTTEGLWKADSNELASAIKFQGPDGSLAASSLPPDDVAGCFRRMLSTATAANAGA